MSLGDVPAGVGDRDLLVEAVVVQAIGKHRVASCSIMLSDCDDYGGGDLCVEGETFRRGKGWLIAFRATTPHEVTPIEWGTRVVVLIFAEDKSHDPATAHHRATVGRAVLRSLTEIAEAGA